MGRIRQFKPTLHVAEDIPRLPKNRPYCVSDLDGTLTEGGGRLLMEIFVEDNVNMGDSDVRQKLLGLFEKWHEGNIKYEPYLIGIGNLWSKMLYKAKETRSNVIQVAENWFDEKGSKRVRECAKPMMEELEKFRFNRLMLTGAPGEIAAPFAKFIGMEHVFAMMADVDSNDVYSSPEILRKNNTGIQNIKGSNCIKMSEYIALGLGIGDTASDSGIANPTIHKNKKNPDDIAGRFIFMEPRPDVTERMLTTHGDSYSSGKIEEIKYDAELPRIMEIFRNTIHGVFTDNDKEELYYEMLGLQQRDPMEIARNIAKRNRLKNQWGSID